MKKLITLGIAMLAFLAINATAGDYHSGTTLNCAECHVMHFSEQHHLTDDGVSGHGNLELGAGGPFHYLLRNHVNELCLTCHDGNAWAPDVLGAPTGAVTNRLGGALNEAGGTVTGYHESDGHSLGFAGVAPGQTGATGTAMWTNTDGLDCTDCHTQHGRKAGSGATATSVYRNLNMPSLSTAGVMSYAVGTNDLTKDVFERFPASYNNDDVDFNEPVATASDYALFCSKCHGDFHGNAASANMRNQAATNVNAEWLRHPVAGIDIGAAGGGGSSMTRAWSARTYRVKTMSASGNWGTQGTAIGGTATVGDFTPSCMTCHKAHGTQNAYGLIFPNHDYTTSVTQPITENGGGADYMGLCRQCHVQ